MGWIVLVAAVEMLLLLLALGLCRSADADRWVQFPEPRPSEPRAEPSA
jgi:hypothetical protein